MVKLNVYLAHCGVASRRKSVDLIKKGKISVNGKVVTIAYTEINEGTDIVKIAGKTVKPQKDIYLAVNKPEGYTCTLKDRFAEHKITELIPASMGKVFPAGRLDKNTSGLMILTTDGMFAQYLTHPSFEVEKEYEVTVTPLFDIKDLVILKKGIVDRGEKLHICSGKVIKNLLASNISVISLVMTEGKKREIRRMFARLGYSVISLRRVRIGNIILGELKTGEYRCLSTEEISFFLKRGVRQQT